MSSSKSFDALDSLETDLRSRLDEEVRTLEAYRGRLEREARVDAELARIDDAIARRISSIPPAAPSYRSASFAPASLLSSLPPPPPAAFPSWNPPTSVLPPASVTAPAPVSQPLPYAYQTSRMVTLATISAMLAVVVSLTVLVISAGDRFVPSASAAERPMTSVVATAPAAAAPLAVAAGGSCSDKSDANAKKDDAKPSAAPEPVVVAKPLGPVAPVAAPAPAPVNVVRRSASRSSVASKPATPSPAPEAAAPAAAAPAAAPAPAATNMDDAARTAQMLREQLGASLK